MITQETIIIDGVELIKTESDTYTIKQVETGIVYESAIDVPGKYTYEETEELKPSHTPETPAEEVIETL